MPILNLNHVSLYYEEFGRGDRYLIQAQQFVNSHIYYTKDLADRCGFHAFIIRIRGYAPSPWSQRTWETTGMTYGLRT